MNNAERVGLMTLFDSLTAGEHNAFWTDINGRLFFNKAPDGTHLSDGPYAIFYSVFESSYHTFTEHIRDDLIQFSLISGESSDSKLLGMDTHLTELLDGKWYSTADAIVRMIRKQSSFSNATEITEMGTSSESRLDVEYDFLIQSTF